MAISSQAAQECAEGSTTRTDGPDRVMESHERAAVRTCTKCLKPTGRFTSARQVWCRDCVSAYSKRHYQKNRDKVLANKADYRSTHKADIKAANAKWRKANADALRLYLAEYRKANRAELLAKKKLAHVEYYARNKAKYVAKFILRRALKEKACPKWADLKAIIAIYEVARAKTRTTGVIHEVDHIIPLKGETVCGLHIIGNLRVISQDENRRKANRLIEDIV